MSENHLISFFPDINHLFHLTQIISPSAHYPHLCYESLNKRIMAATDTLTHEKIHTNKVNPLPNWEKDAEFNRFGIISVVLLIVGCLGGITVGMGAIDHIWSLVLVIIPTMTTLSLLLALAPMRYILYATAASVLIDVILLVYSLIV